MPEREEISEAVDGVLLDASTRDGLIRQIQGAESVFLVTRDEDGTIRYGSLEMDWDHWYWSQKSLEEVMLWLAGDDDEGLDDEAD